MTTGFGTIFATVAMVIIIGISSYLFVTGALFTMDTLSNSLKIANEINNERLKTEIEIVEKPLVTNNGTNVNVSINNTGSTKILKSDFQHIDVFLYYHNNTEGTIHRWIPYNDTNSNALQDNEWTVVSITPDLINPGVFDANEQIKIVIRVYPAIEESSTSWLKVVTPNAVSDAKYF